MRLETEGDWSGWSVRDASSQDEHGEPVVLIEGEAGVAWTDDEIRVELAEAGVEEPEDQDAIIRHIRSEGLA